MFGQTHGRNKHCLVLEILLLKLSKIAFTNNQQSKIKFQQHFLVTWKAGKLFSLAWAVGWWEILCDAKWEIWLSWGIRRRLVNFSSDATVQTNKHFIIFFLNLDAANAKKASLESRHNKGLCIFYNKWIYFLPLITLYITILIYHTQSAGHVLHQSDFNYTHRTQYLPDSGITHIIIIHTTHPSIIPAPVLGIPRLRLCK